jgi:hypothetical protein
LVIAPAGVVAGCLLTRFVDQSLIHELLQIVIEGSWAKPILAARLTQDVLHDAVAMPRFRGQTEKDVQGSGRQWQKGFRVFAHRSEPVISNFELFGQHPDWDNVRRVV